MTDVAGDRTRGRWPVRLAVAAAVAVVILGLVQVAAVISDVLLVHEAARVGARVAATTSGTAPVIQAARQAAEELDQITVEVDPPIRRDGDLAHVKVSVDRRLGPVSHRLSASAVSRVEPAVGTTTTSQLWP